MEFYTKAEYRKQPNPQHEQIISLGAKIIEKLQKLFPELQVEYKKGFKPKSSYKSAMMLTHIKNKLRLFFPEYDEVTRMNWLLKNDDQCYVDLVEDFMFKGKRGDEGEKVK